MASKRKAEIVLSTKKCGPDQSTIICFDYEWNIEGINFNYRYESPIFSPECNKDLQWYLKLHGTSEGMEHGLCLLPSDITEITVTYKMAYLNIGSLRVKMFQYSSSKPTSLITITEYNMDTLLEKADLFTNLYHSQSSASLKVYCNVKLLIPGKTTDIIKPICHHCNTMGLLLEDKRLSDVTINVCDQDFFAHKAILSVRSRVFSAMFEHKMAENLENRVKVTDVESTVFGEMLRYIYTGQVLNIKIMAKGLLAAAEKYELEDLKVICMQALQTNLTIDNVAEILLHAHLLSAEPLKTQAVEFIRVNLPAVIETSGFRAMTQSHPIIMAEILSAIAAKQNSGY